MRAMAQFKQAFAQYRFGQELRHHQGQMIRLGWRGVVACHDHAIGVAAIGVIAPLVGIGTADGDNAVENAQVFKDFLGTWLDSLATRAGEWHGHFFNQTEGYAAARQLNSQGQSRCASTTNQYINTNRLFHSYLHMCNMHILSWSKNDVNKKSAKYTYWFENPRIAWIFD